MKKSILLIFSLLLTIIASAQQKVIPLYEGPPPGTESWNWNEAVNDNNAWHTKVLYNVTKPTLTVFAPPADKANGTAIIICPGGGFQLISIERGGFEVAQWLAEKGITCFVLKYRVAHTLTTDPVAEFAPKWGKKEFEEQNVPIIPFAVADGRAAIIYVRKHALEYNIASGRIGIMGFSAGGTVAISTLYNYTKESRPDFAAALYPYFPAYMHGTVASDAPPLFITTASNDGLGLAPHSVDLYTKWISTKHDAELHMYSKGNHGFSLNIQNLPSDTWIDRFGDWLGVQGLLKKKLKSDTKND